MSSFNVTLMGGSHAQFPLYLDVTDTYTCVINSYNELWDYTPNWRSYIKNFEDCTTSKLLGCFRTESVQYVLKNSEFLQLMWQTGVAIPVPGGSLDVTSYSSYFPGKLYWYW